MKEQIESLEKAFDILNESKFNNELEKPIITIQTKGRSNAFGWCSTIPFWKNNEEHSYHEINISAEYLNRPFKDTIGTLLHEMVHLYNTYNGVDDCSASQYHRKEFKDLAERVGLDVTKDPRYGYAITQPSKEFEAEIKGWTGINKNVFDIFRLEGDKPERKAKKKFYKYRCPQCDTEIKTTKDNLQCECIECNAIFVKIKPKGEGD